MEEKIKASELRLGNYVQDENGRIGYIKGLSPKKVTVKMEFSTLLTSYDDIEPIELTEQWLLDFGFLEDMNFGNWHLSDFKILSLGNFHCAIKEGEVFWYNDSIDDYYSSVKSLKFVHQLQNLYFCLTGKELTLA